MSSAERAKDHDGAADDHEVKFDNGDRLHGCCHPDNIGGALVYGVGPNAQGTNNDGGAAQAENRSQDEFCPHIDLKFNNHWDGQDEDENIVDCVDDGVGKIEGFGIDTCSRSGGGPEFSDWFAREKLGENGGDHVCSGDGDDGEGSVPKPFFGIKAQIEEEDRDFRKAHGGGVKAHCGSCYLMNL